MSDLEQKVENLSMESMDYSTYSLGDFKLKNGGSIPDAKIGQISNVYDSEFLIADISYR